MTLNLNHSLVLALLFLSLFVIAELLFHKLKVPAEVTRKTVHIGTGLICMLFPLWLNDKWYVLALCSSFALLLFVSIKFNLLPSLNNINRKSFGTLLYPLAVYLSFHFYTYKNEKLLFFYLPVLTMAICDPIAALVGKNYGYGKYHLNMHTKSLSGSFAFFVSSLFITYALYYCIPTAIHYSLFYLVLIVALTTTLAESLSYKGFDNITIPLTVILVLTLLDV